MEQNSGADQINNALQQLNSVTQQNAASSEEMSSSAEELSSQAEQLKEVMAFFKIKDLNNTFTTDSFKTINPVKKQNITRLAAKPGNGSSKNAAKELSGVNIKLDNDKLDNEFESYN